MKYLEMKKRAILGQGRRIRGYTRTKSGETSVTLDGAYPDPMLWSVEGRSVQVPVFPDAYQQVEYIESTGSQYIDTGISYYDSSLTVCVRANKTAQAVTYGAVFGTVANSYSNPGFFVTADVPSSDVIAARAGFYSGVSIITSDVAWGTDWHDIALSVGRLVVDGRTFEESTMQFQEITSTIKLFARGGYGTPVIQSAYAKVKISHFKITVGEGVVREFVPCYRKADGEIGMYDLVSGGFFTNLGTGSFLKGGNVIFPSPGYPFPIRSAGPINVSVQVQEDLSSFIIPSSVTLDNGTVVHTPMAGIGTAKDRIIVDGKSKTVKYETRIGQADLGTNLWLNTNIDFGSVFLTSIGDMAGGLNKLCSHYPLVQSTNEDDFLTRA